MYDEERLRYVDFYFFVAIYRGRHFEIGGPKLSHTNLLYKTYIRELFLFRYVYCNTICLKIDDNVTWKFYTHI